MTAYSISTVIGVVTLLASIWYWTLVRIRKKKQLSLKYLMRPKMVKHFIQIPLGAGALMFGIHGLNKEYQSWKKSEARQNIVNKAEAIKEKVDNGGMPDAKKGQTNDESPLEQMEQQMIDMAVMQEKISAIVQ